MCFVALSWDELPPQSVVVDVGGGIGSTSMLLAKTFKHLRFVVQDREHVAEMGLAVRTIMTGILNDMLICLMQAWKDKCPELLASGQAAFQAHDFFTPQPAYPSSLDVGCSPTEGAGCNEPSLTAQLGMEPARSAGDVQPRPAVYLLRVVTHDWPDEFVTRYVSPTIFRYIQHDASEFHH